MTAKPPTAHSTAPAARKNIALAIHRAASLIPMEPREREFLHLLAATGERGYYWNNTVFPFDQVLATHWGWSRVRVRDARLALTRRGFVHGVQGKVNRKEGLVIDWPALNAALDEVNEHLAVRRMVSPRFAEIDVAALITALTKKYPEWRTFSTREVRLAVAEIAPHIAQR